MNNLKQKIKIYQPTIYLQQSLTCQYNILNSDQCKISCEMTFFVYGYCIVFCIENKTCWANEIETFSVYKFPNMKAITSVVISSNGELKLMKHTVISNRMTVNQLDAPIIPLKKSVIHDEKYRESTLKRIAWQ